MCWELSCGYSRTSATAENGNGGNVSKESVRGLWCWLLQEVNTGRIDKPQANTANSKESRKDGEYLVLQEITKRLINLVAEGLE